MSWILLLPCHPVPLLLMKDTHPLSTLFLLLFLGQECFQLLLHTGHFRGVNPAKNTDDHSVNPVTQGGSRSLRVLRSPHRMNVTARGRTCGVTYREQPLGFQIRTELTKGTLATAGVMRTSIWETCQSPHEIHSFPNTVDKVWYTPEPLTIPKSNNPEYGWKRS